ncbi:MAG: bifunctional diaminohydroxyphosphoribosylaminopyrimidine deaminase/5-amino-6-(5-phosphoribosylamino)uracil reductase RibD [Candidatus Hydrogenedentes bacterium]|nr:bifunctional diaminohydroxyphosphoribosylaminopyrimidine deaminase/5-amino-6-(5-phosphoribosylamino)uracil reductase RibD [Candidatus Hydrogenedentota bacterium]
MSTDEQYMRRALELAARGRGRTSPNPMVGCVIVSDGKIIGEGYHERAGGPHAEANAIADARARFGPTASRLQSTAFYITLEPCTHHGKTPPCIDLLLKERPGRVVVAMEDSNPLVAGKGIQALAAAGIPVEVGVLEAEARRLNEAFIKFITARRPFVIAKCAMTLDGKIATRTGHSQWVTGEAARRRVHELRDEVDAILVGSRTVMVDNPRLTTRLEDRVGKDPIRIILDAGDYLSPDSNVFRHKSQAPTWIAVTEPRDYPFANDVIRLPKGNGGVDMGALMEELGRRDVTLLLIEGGGTTLASAFEDGIVDKVMFFIAPKIVGGREAITPVEGVGLATMDEAVQLADVETTHVGEDILVTGYVKQ